MELAGRERRRRGCSPWAAELQAAEQLRLSEKQRFGLGQARPGAGVVRRGRQMQGRSRRRWSSCAAAARARSTRASAVRGWPRTRLPSTPASRWPPPTSSSPSSTRWPRESRRPAPPGSTTAPRPSRRPRTKRRARPSGWAGSSKPWALRCFGAWTTRSRGSEPP
ncbi:hypothetical protein GQ55_5G503200 [Panicum hallii var. hallii]|uniref:Uncharacterized protein n=1 Tax=Panicum hallii var. hallii TaxID=1504633 RepID=A0A2T7DS07_9POAL|nr:hypothetical protein GQ55_5G503200 [Panicum hallii var. hallii]